MGRITASLVFAAITLAACHRQVEVVSGGDVASVTPASSSMLPAGSTLNARLNNELSTERSKVNDRFTLTVTENVIAQNGSVVVPVGATIRGHIAALDDSDNPTDKAVIQLAFDQLTFGGRTYPFSANVTSVASVEERDEKSGTVLRRAGQGAAVGAAIGAIVSGAELDAILKGGAIGAAAGTLISLGVGDVEHRIPAGTMVQVRATQNVSLR